ncbi:MAG: ABC transporter ATP-binding protein [Myxococcales bacterium]|nr:MAG: ABC transporter ATP-binding protein [Myxococcales bacterium]
MAIETRDTASTRGPRRDRRMDGTRDLQMVLGMWRFVRPYRGLFALSMLPLPAISAFLLAQPYIVKRAIDDYIARGTTDGLGWWAILFGACIVGEFFFLYWQHYFTMLVAQKSLADMRVAVFRKVQTMESAFFDHNPIGRLVTRMTTDVDVINEMFAAGALTVIMDLLTLMGIVVILMLIHMKLALVTLSVIPVLVLMVDFFRRKSRRYYRLIRERIARINAYLQECISGVAVIQLFARENEVYEEFDRRNALHRDAYHRSNLYEASLFSIVEAVSNITVALIIWYGAHVVVGEPVSTTSAVAGAVGFGTLVAFIEYMNKFFIPVRDFSTKYAVMQSAITAAERVLALLEIEPSIREPARPSPTPPARGTIEFDRVSFAYIEGEPVLEDLSFTVDAGEHVAIVGATGSGKTTITKLLTRFYDVTSGRILVDGVDVRNWKLGDLRQRVGTVQQDVYLFSDTVLENIRLWDRSIDDEHVAQAAAHVHADVFVDKLHDGYRETVRERGNNFSTGQRQLLSFARALSFAPEILVLDEATSSVDTETEDLIQDAVAILQSERTSLVIAHRLSTIENADRILVLHHGRLREQGTHRELMAKENGVYARLYRLQHEAEQHRHGVATPPP